MVRSRQLNVVLHTSIPCVLLLTLVAVSTIPVSLASGQEQSEPKATAIEPQQASTSLDTATIAPEKYLPPLLLKKVTVKFEDTPLEEVVAWLGTELNTTIRVHEEIQDIFYDHGEYGLTDSLVDQPIYLLLDRLSFLEIDWAFEEGLIKIVPTDSADLNLSAEVRNASDLLDAGYAMVDVIDAVEASISPDDWEVVGGMGSLVSNQDIIIFRQNFRIRREVLALMDGLLSDAERTYIHQPLGDQEIRKALDNKIDVDWKELTIADAVADLGVKSGIDIRFRQSAVEFEGLIDVKEAITVDRDQISVRQALNELLYQFGNDVTWLIRNEVLWITAWEEAEHLCDQLIIYDVSDVVIDEREMIELSDSITSCVFPDSWENVGGPGVIETVKTGKLVVRQVESIHHELKLFLSNYRKAFASSKHRRRSDDVVTLYYKLPIKMAEDMAETLPRLVEPESWKSKSHPDAIGTIHLSNSVPEIVYRGDVTKTQETGVLIITQTRPVHAKLDSIIIRAEMGDHPWERFFEHGTQLNGVFPRGTTQGSFGGSGLF